MRKYPFLSLRASLATLRVATACLFMAHAIVRIVDNTIPQFASFMGAIGFPEPVLVVWAITATELICGACLILDWKVRYMSLGLMAVAVGGIFLIHADQGWFVGEHGTGGSEYSVCLLVCLFVVATADAERARIPMVTAGSDTMMA